MVRPLDEDITRVRGEATQGNSPSMDSLLVNVRTFTHGHNERDQWMTSNKMDVE